MINYDAVAIIIAEANGYKIYYIIPHIKYNVDCQSQIHYQSSTASYTRNDISYRFLTVQINQMFIVPPFTFDIGVDRQYSAKAHTRNMSSMMYDNDSYLFKEKKARSLWCKDWLKLLYKFAVGLWYYSTPSW